jgi:hypothetical protein
VLLQRLVPLDWLFLAHSEVAVGVCTIKIVVLSTDDCPVLARAYDGPMCRSSSAEACTTLTGGVQQPHSRQLAPLNQCHSTPHDTAPTSQNHLMVQATSTWLWCISCDDEGRFESLIRALTELQKAS